jgi:hypothetical protein
MPRRQPDFGTPRARPTGLFIVIACGMTSARAQDRDDRNIFVDIGPINALAAAD